MRIAVIVPVLNEASEMPGLLTHLRVLKGQGCEIIIVDGGSEDGSGLAGRREGFEVLSVPPGRAKQMNAGAKSATSEALLFLHADTRLPANAVALVKEALESRVWGRFDLEISGRSPILAIVAFFMNWRSCLNGIATGDQAIFVRKSAFETVGGFADQPLMEDIELSLRLRAISPPACIPARAVTSGRRWERRGVWRTIFLMWRLRLAYWRGVSPEILASLYR